jgi:VWFA-related protein
MNLKRFFLQAIPVAALPIFLFSLPGCLSARTAEPQDAPPAQAAAKPTFVVPVVVLDDKGNEVTDLKKDSFELLDKGKSRDFTFSQTTRGGKNADGSPTLRFTVYLVNDLGLWDPGDFKRVTTAMEKHFAKLDPDERVAIYTTSCKYAVGNPTDDATKLVALVQSLQFKPPAVCRINEDKEELQMTLLTKLIPRMLSLNGLRNVVLVSPGLWVGDIQRQQEAYVMELANQAHVQINCLDVHGASGMNTAGENGNQGQRSNDTGRSENWQEAGTTGLREISDGTAGTFQPASNDFSDSFARIKIPQNVYYLGIALDDIKADGTVHSLKVSVKDSRKLTVHYRKSLTAPKKK